MQDQAQQVARKETQPRFQVWRPAPLTSLLPFGPGFRLCLFVLLLLVAWGGSRLLLLLAGGGVAILQVGCGLLLQPQPQLLRTHVARASRQLAARGLSWLQAASVGAVHVGCGLMRRLFVRVCWAPRKDKHLTCRALVCTGTVSHSTLTAGWWSVQAVPHSLQLHWGQKKSSSGRDSMLMQARWYTERQPSQQTTSPPCTCIGERQRSSGTAGDVGASGTLERP